MIRGRHFAAVVSGVAALVVAAPALPAAKAGGTTVNIESRVFNPDPVAAAVGDTITWSNSSDDDHNVRGGPFDSPTLHPGNTFSFTFTKPGTTRYVCDLHPNMEGTVKVS